MTPVRLEPAAPRSPVKHSTTELPIMDFTLLIMGNFTCFLLSAEFFFKIIFFFVKFFGNTIKLSNSSDPD